MFGKGNLDTTHTALFHSCNAVMQYLQRRLQAHTKKMIYQCASVYSEYFTLMHRLPNWRKLIYHTTLYEGFFTSKKSSVRLPKDTFYDSWTTTINVEPCSKTRHRRKYRVLRKGETCRCDAWIYKLKDGPSVTVRNVLDGSAFLYSDHQAQAQKKYRRREALLVQLVIKENEVSVLQMFIRVCFLHAQKLS